MWPLAERARPCSRRGGQRSAVLRASRSTSNYHAANCRSQTITRTEMAPSRWPASVRRVGPRQPAPLDMMMIVARSPQRSGWARRMFRSRSSAHTAGGHDFPPHLRRLVSPTHRCGPLTHLAPLSSGRHNSHFVSGWPAASSPKSSAS